MESKYIRTQRKMSKARKNGLMNKEIDQSIFAERDIFYKIKDKEK